MSIDAVEEAEFGEDEHGDVHGFVVADEAGVAAARICGVAFDGENGVFGEVGAGGILDGDGEQFGIVVDVYVF